MEEFELLIRTMHAAKTAQEKGMENIAEALDQLVNRLAVMIDAEIQSNRTVAHSGVARRPPRCLSAKKN